MKQAEELGYENITLRGDLAFRILRNYSRLEGNYYKPEVIFYADQNSWAGDWEGRTMLALVMDARATKREPAYLERMLELLKEKVNEKGYLGGICPEGVFDEQQLSGHNWLLRALLEYYQWKKDEEIRDMAQRIVENLYLPLAECQAYDEYPTDPAIRERKGEEAGSLLGQSGRFLISTDIGCAFMPLDSLAQYYHMFGDVRVSRLLEQMIDKFRSIDFMGASMQTHASLNALRGILTFGADTGNLELLDWGEEFFRFYMENGMTENYANYNWFGRPEWTEPCGIVDSFLAALQLFFLTGKSYYVEIAQKIYYNGLGHAQRDNGGFGCDCCAGARGNAYLHLSGYEAYWCCSMRGAEGLSKAALWSLVKREGEYYFTNYFDGTYVLSGSEEDGEADALLQVKTEYPLRGQVQIRARNVKRPVTLCLFVPSEGRRPSLVTNKKGAKPLTQVQDGFIRVLVDEDQDLELIFELEDVCHETVGKETPEGFYTVFRGVLLMGKEQQEETPSDASDDAMVPVNNSIQYAKEDMEKRKIKIMFPKRNN